MIDIEDLGQLLVDLELVDTYDQLLFVLDRTLVLVSSFRDLLLRISSESRSLSCDLNETTLRPFDCCKPD